MLDCTQEINVIFSDILLRKVDSPTTDLLETGVLDSMALVDLLLHLEERFDVKVNIVDLDLENFRSIQSIAKLVSEQRDTQKVRVA